MTRKRIRNSMQSNSLMEGIRNNLKKNQGKEEAKEIEIISSINEPQTSKTMRRCILDKEEIKSLDSENVSKIRKSLNIKPSGCQLTSSLYEERHTLRDSIGSPSDHTREFKAILSSNHGLINPLKSNKHHSDLFSPQFLQYQSNLPKLSEQQSLAKGKN